MLPLPPSGNLPNPGPEPARLCLPHWQADSLPLCHVGSILATVMLKNNKNSAAMNIEVQTILRDSDLSTSEYITRRGIFGSCSISIFNFLRNLHCFLYQLKFTLPSTVCRGSSFSTTYLIHMHTHTYNSSSNRCVVISHCDLGLHFLMISYIQ